MTTELMRIQLTLVGDGRPTCPPGGRTHNYSLTRNAGCVASSRCIVLFDSHKLFVSVAN